MAISKENERIFITLSKENALLLRQYAESKNITASKVVQEYINETLAVRRTV